MLDEHDNNLAIVHTAISRAAHAKLLERSRESDRSVSALIRDSLEKTFDIDNDVGDAPARKKFAPWENLYISTHWNEHLPVGENVQAIAKYLDRPRSSIYNRAIRLKLIRRSSR